LCLGVGCTGKNGFDTATKIGTTDKLFVAAAKNFAVATKCFVNRTKHFVVVTNFFVIPILTNDFVSITKPFFPVCAIFVTVKLWKTF